MLRLVTLFYFLEDEFHFLEAHLHKAISLSKPKATRTVDLQTASHEEIDQYWMEMLVFGSPELTSFLRGHFLIERTVKALVAQDLEAHKSSSTGIALQLI